MKRMFQFAIRFWLVVLGLYGWTSFAPAVGSESCGPSLMSLQLRAAGLVYLQHKTPIENLGSILRSGKLVFGSSIKGKPRKTLGTCTYNCSSIMFSGITRNASGHSLIASLSDSYRREAGGEEVGDLSQAILIFSPSLVDREDLFVNPTWMYRGRRNPTSIVGQRIIKFVQSRVEKGKISSGEFVLDEGPALLKGYLLEIWVHPSRLEKAFGVVNAAASSSEETESFRQLIKGRTHYPTAAEIP